MLADCEINAWAAEEDNDKVSLPWPAQGPRERERGLRHGIPRYLNTWVAGPGCAAEQPSQGAIARCDSNSFRGVPPF